MKKIILTTTTILAMALFSGCGGGGDLNSQIDDAINGDVEVGADSLRVDPIDNNTGFLVSWTKNSRGYGEVIYTDDLSKPRGDGHPMTSNSTGIVLMSCKQNYIDYSGVHFRCKLTNVTYGYNITLKPNVEYKWLVSYGTDHQHGEVANIVTVDDSGTVEVR